MPHALVFGWGLSLAPHLVDGVAVGSSAAIALILWWPMTMDRLRCWQSRRAAKRQAFPHPNAHAQRAKALLAEWDKARLAKLN
jgi:hypothetical protein